MDIALGFIELVLKNYLPAIPLGAAREGLKVANIVSSKTQKGIYIYIYQYRIILCNLFIIIVEEPIPIKDILNQGLTRSKMLFQCFL